MFIPAIMLAAIGGFLMACALCGVIAHALVYRPPNWKLR